MMHSLLVPDHCSPSTIRSDICRTPKENFVSLEPTNDASMLSLHQIPKDEEGIPTKVTTNQAFDLIASPIKPERALSKRVTVMRNGAIRVLG